MGIEDGGLAGQEWKSRSIVGIKMARMGKESERFIPMGKRTGKKPVVRDRSGGGCGVGARKMGVRAECESGEDGPCLYLGSCGLHTPKVLAPTKPMGEAP